MGPTGRPGRPYPSACRALAAAGCALKQGMEEGPSMNRTNAGERAFAATPAVEPEAIDFVRFCHRRRRVGWPELYDEMCAVAGKGLYRGYGPEELAEIGIGFGLFQMPSLAGLVSRVVAEDQERRRRSLEGIRTMVVPAEGTATEPAASSAEATERSAPDHGSIRIAVPAGA
jgi:hypothetical protein